MGSIGIIITYIMMTCCGSGALATVIKPESGLAKAFQEGLNILGICFVPCMGLMVSIPVIRNFVEHIFSGFTGSTVDIGVIAAMFLPADSGGYALVHSLSTSPEAMIIGMLISMMVGATIAFNVGFGISVSPKEDQKYVALGMMCGLIGIPFGIFFSCFLMMLTKPMIRLELATNGPSSYQLHMTMPTIISNMLPVILLCLTLALCLRFAQDVIVKIFVIFGKIIMTALTLIAAASIIEYYTGIFQNLFGLWPFDGVLADETNTFRAIELIGSIGMVLSGAYPMVYLIRKWFGKKLEKIGKIAGLNEDGSAGLIIGMVNIPAAFTMIGKLRPHDKVVVVAFTICAGYSLADWIAFSLNFQPNLIVITFLGEIVAGICSIVAAKILVLKSMKE